MKARQLITIALAASAGAVFAQTTDLNASSRQQRMDQALANYEHGSSRSAASTANDGTAPAGAATHHSMGSDVRQFGHSFMRDVKQAPHTMAQAGRDTGHRVAEAAREQGHEVKGTAHEAHQAVSGK
jgi:hypothetical protein